MLEAPQPLLTTVDHRKNKSDTTNAIAADESVRTPVGAGKENNDNLIQPTERIYCSNALSCRSVYFKQTALRSLHKIPIAENNK